MSLIDYLVTAAVVIIVFLLYLYSKADN